MPNSAPVLSVIVATRNRRDKLPPMLDALAQAGERARTAWELIVVDNGSTDGTAAALAAFAARAAFPFTVITEPRPGVSRARNRGIAVARGDVLAFTDDDCLVGSDWLAELAKVFAADSAPDFVGGKVVLADNADAPTSIRPFDDATRVTDFGGVYSHLIGCNFAVRRQVLSAVGGFDEGLGAGTPARSAEDTDLFYRVLKAGYRIAYEPRVCVRHAHGRRSAQELAALHYSYAVGRGALYCKHMLRLDWVVWRHVYWELRSLLRRKDGPSAPGTPSSGYAGALIRGMVRHLSPV